MIRSSLHHRFSATSIFFVALLLLATVACAGGADDTAANGGNGESDVATPADGGNGNGDEAKTNPAQDPPADTTCAGANVKIVNVTLAEKGSSGKWNISVDKDTVEITMQGRVCWEVSGLLDGYTLTMSGKSGEDNQFPTRSVSPPPTTINSGAPNGPGTFQYDLILTHGDEEVGKLDPTIIVDPGG